jgi:hypothetical protein
MLIEIDSGAALASAVVSVECVVKNHGFPDYSDYVSGNLITDVKVTLMDGKVLSEAFPTVQEAKDFKAKFVQKVNLALRHR